MNWSTIEPIAVSISALIAAGAFVFAVYERWKRARDTDIENWQKVAIHSMFQKSASTILTLSEIKQLYRSEASAYDVRKLQKRELSEFALRKVILNMIEHRSLDQFGDDSYALLSMHNRNLDGRSEVDDAFKELIAGISSITQTEYQVQNALYRFVLDNPYQFSSAEIALKLSNELGVDPELLRGLIARLAGKQEIRIRDDGKIAVTSEKSIGPEVDR